MTDLLPVASGVHLVVHAALALALFRVLNDKKDQYMQGTVPQYDCFLIGGIMKIHK